MKNKSVSIENLLFAKMKRGGPGTLYFNEQFDGIAENASIRKALQRLTQNKIIVRVAQGIYVIPKQSKLVGIVLPGANDVAKAIAKRDRARIIPTGVQAINLLGLSTQVPINLVYLTDGAPRVVKVGKQTIKLKKTVPKNLCAKGQISGLVIQALKTIGKVKVNESELKKIRQQLKKEKPENLVHDIKLAPAWIAEIMKQSIKIDT
jgi:hypothetical protein